MTQENKNQQNIIELEEKSGKYYKCSTLGYIFLGIFVLLVILGLTFLFAWLKYSGFTYNKQVEATKVNLNYWGEWIEFLPDTLGGFLGIIVGFFFEATLFKKIKESNQRKTLCILLEEELIPIYNANEQKELLIIPTTECIMNSIEGSALFNWQIKYKENNEYKFFNPLTYIYNISNAYRKLSNAYPNGDDPSVWVDLRNHCAKFLNFIDNGRRREYLKKEEKSKCA